MHVDEIKRIAVVGAGLMGHGIGQEFAQAGYAVVLCDLTADKLQRARQAIRRNLEELSDWGLVPAAEIQAAMDRIQTTTAFEEAASDADLVIEAVFEDLALKQQIFRELDGLCPERTILTSNTSTLMPSTLASATRRPDRVLVTHYFYPPHLLPLVEIVRGESTSDETVQVIYRLLKAVGKRPIVVQKEALGFIANRLQVALLREALHIVERGIATPQDVDVAVKNSFGRRLAVAGPFETLEVQDGWDVALQIEKYMLSDLDASKEPSPLILKKIERGELGTKTGRGFYEWTAESAEAWRKKLAGTLAGFVRSDSEQESQL